MDTKKICYLFASVLAASLMTASCKKDDTVEVKEVKLTPAEASVVAGETITLNAEVLPADASDKSLTWFSRDDSRATVDKNGVVTGVSEGRVQIVATASNKKIGTALITVTPAPVHVNSIRLNETEIALLVGRTATLTATLDPADATDPTVTWTSDKENVATVNNGLVEAVGEGEATITATADGKSATCKVVVSVAELEPIAFPYLSQAEGGILQFKADGLAQGDKFKLVAVAGNEYSVELPVTRTADGGSITLPADLVKTRSYKVQLLRDGTVKSESWIHPDDRFLAMPFALGYYMTGDNEVVRNEEGREDRRGYVPGSIVDYNAETKEFRVWKGDAVLTPVKIEAEGTFDIQHCRGIDDISLMKDYFDFSSVAKVFVANSELTALDMTLFPNATELYAWGDPGANLNKIASVTIGPDNKLGHIQLERQALSGVLDLSNLVNVVCEVTVDDNKLTGVNVGSLSDAKCNKVYALSAANNLITEINLENCGRIRILKLGGNKLERATLLMQRVENSEEGVPGYLFLFKAKDQLNLEWATAAEAKGERWIKVEYYWWRCFSPSNADDNTQRGYVTYTEDEWENHGPVIQALKDGFRVDCWHSDSWYAPFSFLESHAGGSDPCPSINP